MKKSTIYEIAIKLGGLYLFFTSISLLKDCIVFGISYYNSVIAINDYVSYDLSMLLAGIGNLGLTLAFAFFFTFGTEKIVYTICNQNDYDEILSFNISNQSIYKISLVLSGLVLIIFMIPQFIVNLREHIYKVENNFKINHFEYAFIFEAIIKIVIGILAIASADMISNFLVKDKKADSEP